METVAPRRHARIAAFTLATVSLVVSLLAAYFKLYFWGGTRYASMTIKLGFWFVILAGPVSLGLAFRRPRTAIAVAIIQFAAIISAAV
jgi:hypothetical protein